MAPDDVVVVLSTAPTLGDGERIGRGLVEARHAACVNVMPGIRSIYRWQGAIEEEQEVQLIIKTTRSCIEPLKAWFEDHHPYDVPELLVLAADGSDNYLHFVREATGRKAR